MNDRRLSTRGRNALLALLAVAVSLPALTVGLFNDDLLHRLMLEGGLPVYRGGWWRLYDFTPPGLDAPKLVDLGYMPWFTHPDLSLRFVRPVSSATLALDHALFGRAMLPAHLHSLAWFAALAVLVAALYRRWFAGRAATLSLLVFVLAGLHGMPLAWLAARHTLVAATFGALALWARIRQREDGWRPGGGLALMGVLLSLASSETGLGAVVFLVAYELSVPVALRVRVRGATPFLAIGLVYLIAYAAGGFGARGSSAYVSPFSAPFEFVLVALRRVPVLAGEVFGAVPSLLATEAPVEIALGVIGVLLAALVLGILWRGRGALEARERRTVAWLTAATLLSLVPMVGTILGGRLLPLAMIGGAALVGQAMSLALRAFRTGTGFWRIAAGAAVGWLVFAHFMLSPLVRVALPLEFARIARGHRTMAEEAELGACDSGGKLYLFTGSDPALALYAGSAMAVHTPAKAGAERLRVISMAPQDHQLVRTGLASFRLEVLGPRRATSFERLYRPPDAPLPAGHVGRAEELSARVVQTEDGLFQVAEFTVDGGLAGICPLIWRDGKLQTFAWPSVGSATRIVYEPGPMGL